MDNTIYFGIRILCQTIFPCMNGLGNAFVIHKVLIQIPLASLVFLVLQYMGNYRIYILDKIFGSKEVIICLDTTEISLSIV